MNLDLIAKSLIVIHVPETKVWDALVNPEIIKKYMFGTAVTSDWKEGSAIIWKGEWEGKPYEDKGVILKIIPNKTLMYTHFSPLSATPDTPENYHTVTIHLAADGYQTQVSIFQDNNKSIEEKNHSEKMWNQ